MDLSIIEDTFAEAFTSYYSRVLITAVNERWAEIASLEATGYGTSMIDCSAEAGIEGYLSPERTPDSRPGCIIQIWAKKKKIKDELIGRLGQCTLTAPTAAVWNYCDSDEKLDIGRKIGFFGDGYQKEKRVRGREVVSIPTMMGEFLIETELGVAKGVAGGNFFILAQSQASALEAAEKAIAAIRGVEGVIAPFPGGICTSGSKIGSKYKFLSASTNEEYCPSLASIVEGSKVKGLGAVAEIVLDGISEDKVREAMRSGIEAAVKVEGVARISAGNYGGRLGDIKVYLRELF
ncbi:MAG: formylmethanofuran--tetrahydromethanopterin N-formyltransferase [Candidatus Hydrothermarchaeales archaeon]